MSDKPSTELQDALDTIWIPTLTIEDEAKLRTIRDAARLVADPNYEAARVEAAAWFDGYRKSSEITAATRAIVAAALTPQEVTGDTECDLTSETVKQWSDYIVGAEDNRMSDEVSRDYDHARDKRASQAHETIEDGTE